MRQLYMTDRRQRPVHDSRGVAITKFSFRKHAVQLKHKNIGQFLSAFTICSNSHMFVVS